MANFEVKLDEEAIKAQVASAIHEALVDLAVKFRTAAYALDPEGEQMFEEYHYQRGFKNGQGAAADE